MNTRVMKKLSIAAVPLTIGCVVLLAFKPAPQNGSIFNTLAGVPAVELPETAAALVAEAPVAKKAAVMSEVLRISATLAKPEVLAYMVSAICKSSPEIAGLTVETSVSLQPGEVLPITKAAVVAAPSSVESIMAGACRVAPQAYVAIAQVAGAPVSQAQPLPTKVTTETRSPLALAMAEQAQTTTRSAADSEQTTTKSVRFAQASGGTVAFKPMYTFHPPFTPPPPLPDTLFLWNTRIVQPGSGRDYSAP